MKMVPTTDEHRLKQMETDGKKLPEGWEWKKLIDCCEHKNLIVSGPFGSNLKVSDYKEKGVPIIRLQNIGDGYFINKDIKYISNEKARELNYHSYKPGDLVLAKLGIPIGKTCFIPKDFPAGIIVADVVRIRPNKTVVDYSFLKYYLNSDISVSQLVGNITGATRPRVNLNHVREIQLPLPPLSEQKRIVAILDEAFAAIDKAKANAEKNLANAKELFESYLNGIFDVGEKGNEPQINGDKRGFSEGCEWKSIQEITRVLNGYAFSSKDFKPTNEIKSIKITNVGVKAFVEEENNFLPENFKDIYSEVRVKEGDIVIALTRTIISSGLKVAIVPKNYDGALVNQRVAALVPNKKKINRDFLYYYLTTDIIEKYVLKHANTLMQPNLSINDLKRLSVPCPHLLEQKRIVAKLDYVFQRSNQLKSIYQQKITDLEELKKSILKKTFEGEL